MPPTPSTGSARLRQVLGLLAMIAFLTVVLGRFTELDRLWRLLQGVRPGWLILAMVLQAAALACTPLLWWLVLRRAGHRHPLPAILPLAYTKVFVDHVVPSGGISGSASVARVLQRQGAPAPLAVAAVVVDFIAYFLGYAAAVLITVLVLGRVGRLDGLAWALVLPFALVAVLVPVAILRLVSPRRGWLVNRLARFRAVARLLDQLKQTPPALVRQPATLAPAAGLRLLVFVFTAATLALLLVALGQPASVGASFAAVVMGSLVTTIGFLPGGLGSYEAASGGTLVLFGVPTEEALAATLLLRGLSFWAPMLPGFWFLRRALNQPPAQRRSTSESNSVPMPSMACMVSVSPAMVMYTKWQTDSENAVKSECPTGRVPTPPAPVTT
jgi:uncharacterized protein (TIRG00374 family)